MPKTTLLNVRRGLFGSVLGITLTAMLFVAVPVMAQLTADDIDALQQQAEDEGWTFTVSANPATSYSLDELCGLKEPENWQATARFDPMAPRLDLPSYFDWRDTTDMPPVRNQGGCGSCWAFATVGALECNIKIRDLMTENLSEQWLVSCNHHGWDCGGGWWAHDYHLAVTDPCDSSGAVMEAQFPYTASNAPCGCPYEHPYHIESWAYVGSSSGVPSTAQIKQAILEYGPVTVAVYVNSSFQAYGGGVFNGCTEFGSVNHGVVLVGWDDSQGPGGVWFMRNSWGSGWGEGGYMRIPYGCSKIGYATSYVNYQGGVAFEADTTIGWVPFDVNFTGISGLDVDTWTWDFGDGGSSYEQSPMHTFSDPGLFPVTLEINAGGDIRSRQKPNFIKALADSLKPVSTEGYRSTAVIMPIYVHNYVPISTIKIPIEYSGDLDVTLDSFSTVGCRAEYFEVQTYIHYDPAGKKQTIKLVSSYSGTSPHLPAGEGAVANLFFTLPGSAGYDDTTYIQVDGYYSYTPQFSGMYATYEPRVTHSTLTICFPRGDCDGDSDVTVGDITYLVEYLFNGGLPSTPLEAADVDCGGDVNVGDITYLVQYLFGGGPEPCGCS